MAQFKHRHAMVLEKQGEPLKYKEVPCPGISEYQVLLKVHTCGICRTDIHILDGDLKHPKLPLIPGHEIVGTVIETGRAVKTIKEGDRVGVPWLGYTCGRCRYCLKQQENLCENALFTGYTIDGGYTEYTVADARYCFLIPSIYDDAHAAPLLCAGLIGYRSYKMIGDKVKNLGIYGFGAAAHILVQIAHYQGKQVFAFTKEGDTKAQQFAMEKGAAWIGDSTQQAPERLDAAIIFAPAGQLIPVALKNVDKGGVVVCGGIHMTDIPSFPYSLLWEERMVRSVANLTRTDGEDFFSTASDFHINTDVHCFALKEANFAIDQFRNGVLEGATVLSINT